MFTKIIKFPIWKNDGKSVEPLTDLQKIAIRNYNNKIINGEYKFVDNPCLCGKKDDASDLIVAEKDRFGIPCTNLLCQNCGLIRIAKKLNDSSIAEFYKSDYRNIYSGREATSAEFFEEQEKRGHFFLKFISEQVKNHKIKTVFEIGCGAGGVLYPFHKSGMTVAGCDLGAKYLKYGKEKGLDIYEGEINSSRTPKNSQDLVIISHVMEHFTNPIKQTTETVKYIRPGGYALIEVPGIFDIPKTYFNPILYFQNAHIFNFYYQYLEIFFQSLGLLVLFGDERCTFLLKKPIDWKESNTSLIHDNSLKPNSEKIEKEIRKYYLLHLFKINPYYYKNLIIRVLVFWGIKDFIKKLIIGS